MVASNVFICLLSVAWLNTGLGAVIPEPLQPHVNEDTCHECTRLLELYTSVTSSQDSQEGKLQPIPAGLWVIVKGTPGQFNRFMKNSLKALCLSLPGAEDQTSCLENLEKNLPQAIKYLTSFIRPDKVCTVLGMCGVAATNREAGRLTNSIADYGASVSYSEKGTKSEDISPECTFCVFLIKKLESLLPKNRTEEAIMKALGEVCQLLPESYSNQCQDFVDKYGKEVIEFLLSSAAPHTICTLLHLCLFQERAVVDTIPLNDCQACQTLMVLSQSHLSSNVTAVEISSFLDSVCLQYPYAMHKCELFIQQYGPQLRSMLGKEGSILNKCERAELCVTVRRVEMLGINHCTWGNNYRCKDEKTAKECNSMSYCRSYVWK